MRILITSFLTFILVNAAAQDPLVAPSAHYYLLVGTYDSPESEGIYVYDFDAGDGSTKAISHIKTSNPSFLAISPDHRYVYAVNENADSITHKGGSVSSFSFDKKSGKLKFISKQNSGGDHPCYVSVDKTGKWVLAGNYSSGNFSVLPVIKNGLLGKAKSVIGHKGAGPDSSRQRSAHVHAVYLKNGGTELYVPDLGMDKVMLYRLNATTGAITPSPAGAVKTDPGTGPRHIDFHPNGKFAYLMLELNSNVVVYKTKAGGGLEEIQTMSALPNTYRGPQGGAADIHVSPDGKFLYCSIRGLANTIAVFAIDPATGMLTPVESVFVEGEKPRNFNFDPTGNFLLVGNQNSDEIVLFNRDAATGKLTDSGKRIKVGKPVCIKWILVK
jgi:6-phosphogluconolactonase